MPTDYPAAVYGAWFNALQNGVNAYNAAVTAGTVVAPTVKPTQLMDNRTDGRQRMKVGVGAPVDFPQIRLGITGGNFRPAPSPTFGFLQGVAGCDAIVPRTVQLTETITYDSGSISDAQQTPLESYIDAAVMTAYPKFGLPYTKPPAWTETRRDRTKGGKSQVVRERVITFELWTHIGDLR